MAIPSVKPRDTPFLEAVQVEPVTNSKSQFTADIPRDWCGTPAAHGGYLQALIFSTARAYFLTHHPARNQPDPISAHVQFLKQVWPGPVRLSVKPVNIGSRVSVIQIELSQSVSHSVSQNSKSHSQATDYITGVIAIVTQSNLATESGLSLPTVPTIPKSEIPDREKDCVDFIEDPFIKAAAPTSLKADIKVLPGGIDRTGSDHRGRSFRELWLKFADGTNWDVLSLGWLSDAFGGAPNNYAPDNIDYKLGIVYPTLSMVTEIKKDPRDAKWLFMRMRTHEIRNGRFDTEVTIVDEMGDLVCMSRHVSLILTRKTPEELKKIYKL
ncbi:hypothetical protein D0Z07_0658 [Hyphodiscus hymeniophilus]|uniref:Thioesterase-like superfamily-domain-containing protein n=1 Tax=Hyphodiscus hymeniophilus TaxID=353542 RepID=A0A9P7B0R9_9HELO|nr:hypothetical protein D0Z07_0658 [Hyphodiscus hymeniophilus]